VRRDHGVVLKVDARRRGGPRCAGAHGGQDRVRHCPRPEQGRCAFDQNFAIVAYWQRSMIISGEPPAELSSLLRHEQPTIPPRSPCPRALCTRLRSQRHCRRLQLSCADVARRLRPPDRQGLGHVAPAFLLWLASVLSISHAVGPGVAGCLGNGSMLARGGSLMERLWIREVRRAARRASAPFARQVALGCAAAAVGTIAASLLPTRLGGSLAQAVWAGAWAVAGYVAIWTGLFIYHLWRYRSSGFRDHDWFAGHDDSDPSGALFLELGRRSGGSPHRGVGLELWVKSHGSWVVVDEDDVVLMPDKVIRCRFDLNHEVFPGSFYDVRWFRADDRAKFVEITRERFQLRKHPVGPRRGLSPTNTRLAPKALPSSEDEIKPRRAVEAR